MVGIVLVMKLTVEILEMLSNSQLNLRFIEKRKEKRYMMEHLLLAGMSGLLAYHNKEDKFLFWLWIVNYGMWSINFISDIVRLVMS